METNPKEPEMKNEFLTLLTDGKIFVAPEIQPHEMAENRVRAYSGRDMGFKAVSIPLATVLASRKLLDALRGMMDEQVIEDGRVVTRSGPSSSAILAGAAAISEATEGGATELPRQSAPSPFTVCAYAPAVEKRPVLCLCVTNVIDGKPQRTQIGFVCRYGDTDYELLREAAGGDQNIVWLYGQNPQPLE